MSSHTAGHRWLLVPRLQRAVHHAAGFVVWRSSRSGLGGCSGPPLRATSISSATSRPVAHLGATDLDRPNPDPDCENQPSESE
jgi:hypothetical protein